MAPGGPREGSGSSNSVDRRGFFTQGLSRALREAVDAFSEKVAPNRYIRPPGALPEPAFLGACTRCDKCADACPVHAITKLAPSHGLAAGTPVLEVATTACIMCETMPCAAACPTAALDVPELMWGGTKIAVVAIDTTRCITYRDVECGICARVCPVGEDALRMDERGRPVIGDACTGCGRCIGACVTAPSSISAAPLEMLT